MLIFLGNSFLDLNYRKLSALQFWGLCKLLLREGRCTLDICTYRNDMTNLRTEGRIHTWGTFSPCEPEMGFWSSLSRDPAGGTARRPLVHAAFAFPLTERTRPMLRVFCFLVQAFAVDRATDAG